MHIALQQHLAAAADHRSGRAHAQLLHRQAPVSPPPAHADLLSLDQPDRQRGHGQGRQTHPRPLDARHGERPGDRRLPRRDPLHAGGANVAVGQALTADAHPIAHRQALEVVTLQRGAGLPHHLEAAPRGVQRRERADGRVEHSDPARAQLVALAHRLQRHPLAHRQLADRAGLPIAFDRCGRFVLDLDPVDADAGKAGHDSHDACAAQTIARGHAAGASDAARVRAACGRRSRATDPGRVGRRIGEGRNAAGGGARRQRLNRC